jgi:hypothetical protein
MANKTDSSEEHTACVTVNLIAAQSAGPKPVFISARLITATNAKRISATTKAAALIPVFVLIAVGFIATTL